MQIDDKRTKAQLFELITQKFKEDPELKDDARFSGMFKRGQKRPAPVNDDLPPFQHRRLNLMPPPTPRPDPLPTPNDSQSLSTPHPSIAGPSRLAIDHYSSDTYNHHTPTYPPYYPISVGNLNITFDHFSALNKFVFDAQNRAKTSACDGHLVPVLCRVEVREAKYKRKIFEEEKGVELHIKDDERTHLIPDDLSPLYSDPALMSHHRLQQKLDTIVRAKERKMVNVVSQIPFNLHNQVLPPEHHSLPRDPSGEFDNYDDGEGYFPRRPHARRGPYHRFTTSASPDPYNNGSRSSSPERQPPTPILNVRLVGYVDRRGRTMRRSGEGAKSPSDGTPTCTASNVDGQSPSPTALVDKFKLHEVGAISMSWGD
ncbi:hypothetical protein H0H92_011811 [Tricholoma furcatifolium]|nr:hypothetical protein H0H92_011811 [Tricholoma furcatifolium]